MSKAKELATNVISQMEEIQRQVMNNNSLSGFTKDWQSGFNHAMIELRNRLNEAVLSEPEQLRGWIEVTNKDDFQMLINLAQVENVGPTKENGDWGAWIETSKDDSVIFIKESYDSIKQKIKGAS